MAQWRNARSCQFPIERMRVTRHTPSSFFSSRSLFSLLFDLHSRERQKKDVIALSETSFSLHSRNSSVRLCAEALVREVSYVRVLMTVRDVNLEWQTNHDCRLCQLPRRHRIDEDVEVSTSIPLRSQPLRSSWSSAGSFFRHFSFSLRDSLLTSSAPHAGVYPGAAI